MSAANRSVSFVLAVAMMFMLFTATAEVRGEDDDKKETVFQSAIVTYWGIVNSSSYIRTAPSVETGVKLLDSTGYPISLAKGFVLQIIDQVKSLDSNYPNDWYKVRYVNVTTGIETECYIYSDNVTKRLAAVYTASMDLDFEASISQFPSTYIPYLRALHELYPEWEFEAVQTSFDFDAFVKEQTRIFAGNGGETASLSSVHYTRSNPAWRKTNELVDGNSFYHASDEVVAYYLDPRNFLNEVDIFQFESIGYRKDDQTIEGVENLLHGSFMNEKYIKDLQGNSLTYAEAYMEAAEASGVSPYNLAISTILENGKTGTMLTNGSGGYYNFYGVGSVPGGSPMVNGLTFARTGGSWSQSMKEECMIPWNTPYKAIVGGAIFMGKSYISIGQNTAYFKRFDIFSMESGSSYLHQYMGDVEYPVKDGFQSYNTYSSLGILQQKKTFIIPVYKNMSQVQYALPGTTSMVLVSNPEDKPILQSSYRFSDDYITNVSPGTSLSGFKNGLILGQDAEMSIAGDDIGTGTVVKLTYKGETKEYRIVIRGDVNGDSQITITDLLMLRNHVLGTIELTPYQLTAANIDGDNEISMVDILKLRDGILGTYIISQEIIS